MNTRTSAFRRLAILSLSALAFAACDNKEITPPVAKDAQVVITPSSGATLSVGQTTTFIASVSDDTTGANSGVTFTSTNTAVATVAQTGNSAVVTAVAPGTATIVATSKFQSNKSAAAQVTVTAAQVTPVNITLTPSSAPLTVGGTLQLVTQITGPAGVSQAVTYVSSDTSVAKVSATGLVTATQKNGTAVITATAGADVTKTASSVITVSGGNTGVTSITITPTAQTVSVGDSTFAFVATVSGNSNTAKTFTSSNPTVATINSTTGVIKALSTGSTVITATSTGDATKSATATLTVSAVTQPSISITNITQTVAGVTTNVAPGSSVSGTISVQIHIENGNASSIQRVAVRLTPVGGGAAIEACSQTFTPPLAPSGNSNPTCTFSTAQLNSTTGAALLVNGNYTVTADAFSTASGSPIATATWGNLTLNNTNSVNGVVTYDNSLVDDDNTATVNSAVDGAGKIWNGGTATVTLTPAVFTGTPIATLDITMDQGCDGAATGVDVTKTVTIAANGSGSATFSEANNVGAATPGNDDVQNALVCYVVGNAKAANTTPVALPANAGTGGVSTVGTAPEVPVNSVDNVQPVALGTVFSVLFQDVDHNSFAGTSTAFTTASTSLTGATTTDAGVSGVTYAFYAIPGTTDASTTAKIRAAISGMTAISGATGLTGSVSNDAYQLVETATDKLGNITYRVLPTKFGVDLVAPTIGLNPNVASAANNATNPTLELNMEARDSISGLRAIRARITSRRTSVAANGTGTATTRVFCIDGAGVETAVPASGVCATFDIPAAGAAVGDATITIPAIDGLYTIEAQALDRAGNLSGTQTFTELVDTTVPAATVTSNTTTTTGGNTTVSIVGDVSDNVDLAGYDLRFRFPTVTSVPTDIPFSQMTQVGNGYGLPLVGLVSGATGSNTSLPIRELNEGGVIKQPTQFGFGAIDVAGNYGASGFTATTVGVGDGISNLNSFQIASSKATICRTGTNPPCASTATTSTTITATINTTPTASDPITTVLFYYVHAGADNTIGTGDDYLGLISQVPGATAPTQTGVTDRLYTVTQTLNAASLPNAGAYRLVAVGVDADGDAILSNVVALTVQ